MALPVSFRYFLARLSPLARPLVLSSSLFLVLIGIFLWEYRNNPDWFGAYSPEETDRPTENLDLSQFTPEEQSAIAEIDNLSVLFNEIDVSGSTPTSEATAEGPQSLLQQLLGSGNPIDSGRERSGTSAQPFQRYLEQYQFLGGQRQVDAAPPNLQGVFRQPAVPRAGTTSFATGSPQAFGTAPTFGSSQVSGASQPFGAGQAQTGVNAQGQALSALGQALLDLTNPGDSAAASRTAASGRTTTTTAPNAQAADAERTATSSPQPGTAQPSLLNGGQANAPGTTAGSNAVYIPGIPYPVLPTTPNMSPPPGTTGYVPPSSLNLRPPGTTGANSASPNAASGFPAPIPGFPTAPTVPTAGGAPLDLSRPDVGAAAGSAFPSPTPVVPNASQPFQTIGPEPYAIPRPPGSYTGGGYIYTFSNPNGPSAGF